MIRGSTPVTFPTGCYLVHIKPKAPWRMLYLIWVSGMIWYDLVWSRTATFCNYKPYGIPGESTLPKYSPITATEDIATKQDFVHKIGSRQSNEYTKETLWMSWTLKSRFLQIRKPSKTGLRRKKWINLTVDTLSRSLLVL